VRQGDRLVEAGVSIVCVYNDPDVRRECLDRSVAAYAGALDVDYIPVDNTRHAFSSAGAALNHGARQARHDLVVLVHQDVYLHSLDRLFIAAAAFGEGGWGLLGANGVTVEGESVGRLCDRVQLIGSHAPTPVDVDSVDEVLFMVPRELLLSHPLTEDPDLAWHAYAVEYGLRLRQMDKRVGAVDLAITHNSLTINLAKLDVAHRRVGLMYPELRPVRTTCGTIGIKEPRWRHLPVIRQHRWRLRWLRHSLVAAKVRRRMNVPVVLSDIRHEVDLLPFSDESPLHLFNVDRVGGFSDVAAEPLRFTRYGRPVIMRTVRSRSQLMAMLGQMPPASRILVVDVEFADLEEISRQPGRDRDWLVGIQSGALWLLGGPGARELPGQWSLPQAVPLGARRAS
jgi:hypothetical protein